MPVNPINTTHTRDAALRQLGNFNRGLIAGSVVLAAVLTDVAANAFPGKSTKHTPAAKTAVKAKTPTAPTEGAESSAPLAAPSQTPSASAESSRTPESSQQAAPESSQQAAPEQTQQAAPEPTQHETEPTPQAAPEQESSGPVVSGGS
jgi:predicted lipid-binding transport protein (Tim44 family)